MYLYLESRDWGEDLLKATGTAPGGPCHGTEDPIARATKSNRDLGFSKTTGGHKTRCLKRMLVVLGKLPRNDISRDVTCHHFTLIDDFSGDS